MKCKSHVSSKFVVAFSLFDINAKNVHVVYTENDRQSINVILYPIYIHIHYCTHLSFSIVVYYKLIPLVVKVCVVLNHLSTFNIITDQEEGKLNYKTEKNGFWLVLKSGCLFFLGSVDMNLHM